MISFKSFHLPLVFIHFFQFIIWKLDAFPNFLAFLKDCQIVSNWFQSANHSIYRLNILVGSVVQYFLFTHSNAQSLQIAATETMKLGKTHATNKQTNISRSSKNKFQNPWKYMIAVQMEHRWTQQRTQQFPHVAAYPHYPWWCSAFREWSCITLIASLPPCPLQTRPIQTTSIPSTGRRILPQDDINKTNLLFSQTVSVFPQLSHFLTFSVFPQLSQFYLNFLSFSSTFSVFLSTFSVFPQLYVELQDQKHKWGYVLNHTRYLSQPSQPLVV